jgi:tetratricopeptide (TPR) repeat protein
MKLSHAGRRIPCTHSTHHFDLTHNILMTEAQETQSVPENDAEKSTSTIEAPPPEAEPEPPPEPWTPERVIEWNAYYDLYVLAATLLLAFVVSCNYVSDSSIFAHLKAGQLINDRTGPLLTDEFSYTEAGQTWVDLAWLFQWSHSALYNFIHGLVPIDPNDPTANRERADQIAVGALGVVDALTRLLAAWLLLKVRHRGPGLWWSAICVTAALGVVYHPFVGIAVGGIARISDMSPGTGGQLFLALEVLLLFRAFGQGRPAALWALIPLFLLWCNWDISFLTGLLVLAATAAGRWLDGSTAEWLVSATSGSSVPSENGKLEEPDNPPRRPASAATGFLVLGLCAAACLVNPWTYRSYHEALRPILQLFQPGAGARLAFFNPGLKDVIKVNSDQAYLFPVFYLVVVALGIGSFLLNAPRFAWSRFLPFAVVSVLWGLLMHYSAEFAIVFAAVMALNGQEWYQARFGAEGRLGRMWTLWSTGGRLVTLTLIFLTIGKDITGWHNSVGNRFGLGYEVDDFPFEAAEFLDQANEIKGNVFNTSSSQGDILIWKASPKRKVFLDGRSGLFPHLLYEEWRKLRKAISDDEVATWKPLLDQYNVSAVMIEPTGPDRSPLTYEHLLTSPNWIPFYDDGRIVMFGRSDADPASVAVFKANRLEPDRAYRVNRAVPSSPGPPGQTSWIDAIFESRTYNRQQMRNESARRWLVMGEAGKAGLPEPAQCLLAIQEARIALSHSPDDWVAFRRLNDAYRVLMIQETAMLAGIPITSENRIRISTLAPSPERLMTRFRQRVTALNFAIQTTPPPQSQVESQQLFELNMEMYQLFMAVNFRDLARDRLKTALELRDLETFLTPEVHTQLKEQLSQLDRMIKDVLDRLDDQFLESPASPVDQANIARQQGAVGQAIEKLAEAERNGVSPMYVKPQLIDLYCASGQPDKALDLLGVGSVEDPSLGTEPGAAAYRQGMVYMLLGNYLSTDTLWRERSIPRVRFHRTGQLLSAGQLSVRGNAMMATNTFMTIPNSLQQQATWEFDLAMCQLEGGLPDAASEHFTKALTLDPDLSVRPIAAYYLEKLGKPVPPARGTAGAKKPATTETGGAPAGPTVPTPAAATSPAVPVKPVSPEPAKGDTTPEPAKTKAPAPEAEKASGKAAPPKPSS